LPRDPTKITIRLLTQNSLLPKFSEYIISPRACQ
jgi:hypothetical protein